MLYKKVRKPKLKFKYRATDVLYSKMMFYNDKATIITEALINWVQNQQQARGDWLIQLSRDLHKFNEIVIECATKLAPYQSPKLESVEVRNEHVHKFVMLAPRTITSKDKWLDIVKAEQKLITDATFEEGKLN